VIFDRSLKLISVTSDQDHTKEKIMDDIKKILVAVGLTEYAEGLVNYAVRLAESLNAELVLANIINTRDVEAVGTIAAMGYEIDSEHYVSKVKDERRQSLNRILAKISFPDDKMRTILKVGHPVDELLKIVISENVDMLVMGVKGRTDLENIFIGSVAEKLFRRSPVTVVSYRDEKNMERLRKRIPLT
jgi:nucleotide-binding universal stress UspA family protein